jgi:4-hydroxy-tetrahydrodipicolinate synthase
LLLRFFFLYRRQDKISNSTLNVEEPKNIIGYKDTILEMGHTCDLIKTVKSEIPKFEVFSGYDNNFAHNILSGGNGCIGGLSNLIPEFFADWIRALEGEDLRAVSVRQKFVDGMMDIYTIGNPFVPIIKKALILRGMPIADYCSAPIPRADARQTGAIGELLQKMGVKQI